MALGSCVLTHQAANSTQDPSSAPASVSGSSTVVQGGGQRLAVYLNRGAKAGDTLTLSLSEALGSLHQAKARDGIGLLMAAVQTYLAAAYDKVRSGALTELMFRWAGVYNVDPASRGLGATWHLAACQVKKHVKKNTSATYKYWGYCYQKNFNTPHLHQMHNKGAEKPTSESEIILFDNQKNQPRACHGS